MLITNMSHPPGATGTVEAEVLEILLGDLVVLMARGVLKEVKAPERTLSYTSSTAGR